MIALIIFSALFVLFIMGIVAYVLYTDLTQQITMNRDLFVSLSQRLKALEQRKDVVIYSDEKVRWN